MDSSPLYQDESQDPQLSGSLLINPYVGVRTPEPRALELTADLGAVWEQFTAQESAQSASRGPADQSGLDLEANVGVRVNPNGVVSVTPSDRLSWATRPNRSVTGDPFRVLQNEFDIAIGLHPGGYHRGERLGLSGELGFTHRLWRYDQLEDYDRQGLGGRLDLQWNFLPKTAIFLASSLDTVSYENATITSTSAGGAVQADNNDSMTVRASLGFTGLLTRRLSVLASGGFGTANYDNGQDVSTYLTHLELGVHMADRNRISFGWEHNFADALLSNFLEYHRVYAQAVAYVGGLNLGLQAYVNLNEYSTVTASGTEVDVYNGPRKDTVVGGVASVSYTATPWLTVGVRYNPSVRDSTATFSDGQGGGVGVDYVQHRAFFFVDLAAARPLPLAGVSGADGAWLAR